MICEELILKRCREANIPSRFLKASLKDFKDVDIESCLNWLYKSDWNMLYFSGRQGRGKTHLACAIAKDYIDKFYINNNSKAIPSVSYTSLGRIVFEIRKSFEQDGMTEFEVLHDYLEKDLLVVDDLGQDRQSDFNRNVIFNIANYRMDCELPTIYITLREFSDMRDKLFSPEIMSRIFHNVVNFKGNDKRQKDLKTMEIIS